MFALQSLIVPRSLLFFAILTILAGCGRSPMEERRGTVPDAPWREVSPVILQVLATAVGEEAAPSLLRIAMNEQTSTNGWTLMLAEGITSESKTFAGLAEQFQITPAQRDRRTEYTALRAKYQQIQLGPQELYEIAQTVYPEPMTYRSDRPLMVGLRIDLEHVLEERVMPVWSLAFSTTTHEYTILVNAVDGTVLSQEAVNK